MTTQTVQLDPIDIIKVLQETHPEAVHTAIWRVRAEKAEAEAAALRAAAQPADAEPADV